MRISDWSSTCALPISDRVAGDLLVRLGNSHGVAALIADALGQNFTGDYQELLGKIGRASEAKRGGDFVIHADPGYVETGAIPAPRAGVYLHVRGSGDARAHTRPEPTAALGRATLRETTG